MRSNDMVKEVKTWLYQNNIFAEEVYTLPNNEVVVSVSGDWQHVHKRCDYLMTKFCENKALQLYDKSMDVLKEDGSDYYTAEHYYKIREVN